MLSDWVSDTKPCRGEHPCLMWEIGQTFFPGGQRAVATGTSRTQQVACLFAESVLLWALKHPVPSCEGTVVLATVSLGGQNLERKDSRMCIEGREALILCTAVGGVT